jgi:hypothetical protein
MCIIITGKFGSWVNEYESGSNALCIIYFSRLLIRILQELVLNTES